MDCSRAKTHDPVVWLTTAKRPETRDRRIAETLRALASDRKWIDRKLA